MRRHPASTTGMEMLVAWLYGLPLKSYLLKLLSKLQSEGETWLCLAALESIYSVESIPELGAFSPLHFLLTDFLSLLQGKIDFCLQNVFMGMRAFQWKALQIIHKHQASLGEVRLCLPRSFFTESATI